MVFSLFRISFVLREQEEEADLQTMCKENHLHHNICSIAQLKHEQIASRNSEEFRPQITTTTEQHAEEFQQRFQFEEHNLHGLLSKDRGNQKS